MQLPTSTHVFNKKNVEGIIRRESAFMTGLLDLLPLPSTASQFVDSVLLNDSQDTEAKRDLPKVPNKAKTSRAKSLVELQARLVEISSRKRLNYKEKLLKKSLKTKIQRKGKQSERNANQKKQRAKRETDTSVEMKEDNGEQTEASIAAQPDDNATRMVFSKFDFSDLGRKKHKKEKQDPQKVLSDLQKQKEKINNLRAGGETDKAAQISEKSVWKNALAKSQGAKVKDNEELLARSIKKREQKLKKSRKQWQARQEHVRKQQEDKQKKRQENIMKKKKTKKVTKMKKAVKRGRIIPGF